MEAAAHVCACARTVVAELSMDDAFITRWQLSIGLRLAALKLDAPGKRDESVSLNLCGGALGCASVTGHRLLATGISIPAAARVKHHFEPRD